MLQKISDDETEITRRATAAHVLILNARSINDRKDTMTRTSTVRFTYQFFSIC
jgi:hypothetical protein